MQIALQAAVHGVSVTVCDLDDDAVARARRRLAAIVPTYVAEVPADADQVAAAADVIRFLTDLADSVRDADLVIEAVPEDLELKRQVYRTIAGAAPQRTVFATNTSTLLPSLLADATGRPDRFLALHFANNIWRQNTAEVMGHPATDPQVYRRVVAFAEEIGMVAIQLHKEQPGYLLNSLLVPFLQAGAQLLVRGVADPHTIDTTWRIGTGAPVGPFQIYDIVGLRTAYAIALLGDDDSQAFAAYLKEHYLDHGKLGRESGEGFYRYDA
jgi:3-hydroxyacyl-CoA dehydrogenase